MKTPKDYSIDLAYSYESPSDLKRYYDDSAEQYDEFVSAVKYVLPSRVVDIAREFFGDKPERAIDIGCGTGLIGVNVGVKMPSLILDGLDISPNMIYQAYDKKRRGGNRCYSSLILSDATREKALESERYTLMLSAGTFTLGHLKPEHLETLLGSLVKDGMAVISIKSDHYEKEDFLGWFSDAEKRGIIATRALISVDSFDNPNYSAESIVAVLEKRP
jgi:predicted TPR repeat methyltransferase